MTWRWGRERLRYWDDCHRPLCRHPANTAGRDFVVGDLHGCVDVLRALLHDIRFDPARDRLFSVGDLVDRGPASETTLDLLDRPWCHVVRGNHEEVLSLVARGKLSPDAWRGIGGDWGPTCRRNDCTRMRHASTRCRWCA